jgi:uncharacterized protein
MIFVFLFIVAAVGGALNSVAGGGSFLTLPALLFAGITPVAANATSTLVMWPASVSSTIAYRREVTATPRKWLLILCGTSLVGGLAGAVLLVRTSDTSFMRLLPWLMLVAAVTFTFGGRVRAFGERVRGTRRAPRASGTGANMMIIAVMQFFLSIYGGYFGGGMGIMMLAMFSLAGMIDIHEMNGLKTLLGVAINALALLEFVVKGAVAWGPGLFMMGGSILGGYFGAALARRMNPAWVRGAVIGIGWTMTVYFFLRPHA